MSVIATALSPDATINVHGWMLPVTKFTAAEVERAVQLDRTLNHEPFNDRHGDRHHAGVVGLHNVQRLGGVVFCAFLVAEHTERDEHLGSRTENVVPSAAAERTSTEPPWAAA